MRGKRARRTWSDLRAPAGGVRITAPPVDPAEALRTTLINMFVVEYDDALRRHDTEAATRLVTALRELGVRV